MTMIPDRPVALFKAYLSVYHLDDYDWQMRLPPACTRLEILRYDWEGDLARLLRESSMIWQV